MDTKKLIAGFALAGTVVLGTTGVAFAADGSGSGSGSSGTSNSATAPAKGHPRLRRMALKDVLTLTNSTPQQLRDALKGGQTIGAYADAHGSSRQAVIDDLTSKADAAIDKAVSNHKITQDRANTLKGKVPGAVTKFVDRTWGQGHNAPTQPTS
jgi:hypothetical protein